MQSEFFNLKFNLLIIMLKHYETVFILTPVLSEDQMKEAANKFKEFISTNGGEIITQENWGLKKLAYPIQKKSTGFYHLIEFKSEGDLVDKIETQFRRDEKVLRFLTVTMDKYHKAFAEKMRNKAETENV